MKAGNVVNCAVSVPATRHATAAKSGQLVLVRPIPFSAARTLIERSHYLHSMPGGTKLTFGAFVGDGLLGAISLGAGPQNAFSLVHLAKPEHCLCLTRLWLSDSLPKNSESRVIGIVLRALRRYTEVKFVISYADPSRGHLGTIYQTTNFLYIGLSQPMPFHDLGDGKGRHSRSLAHGFGTHSVKHLMGSGVEVALIEQSPKHRYIYFLDASWRGRLKPDVLPYPRNELLKDADGGWCGVGRGCGYHDYEGVFPLYPFSIIITPGKKVKITNIPIERLCRAPR